MNRNQIRAEIMQRLRISDEQYGMIMYETGEEYFEWRCNGFTQVLDMFRKSQAMWEWWINQYFMIDEAIIQDNSKLTQELYRAIHLGLEYYPDEAIVQRAMDEYEHASQREITKCKRLKQSIIIH